MKTITLPTALPQPTARNLQEAQQEILKRLIRAFVRETPGIKTIPANAVPNYTDSYKIIIDQPDEIILTVNKILQPSGRAWITVVQHKENERHNLNILDLLSLVLSIWQASPSQVKQITAELQNCYNCMALAFAWEIQNMPLIHTWITLACNTQKDLKKRRDALLYSEAIPFTGHPIHVCSKTKIGFTNEDNLAYNPEFAPKVGLKILAVHRRHIIARGNFNLWQQYISQVLPISTLNDYVYFPVHPWQYEHLLQSELYADLLNKKELILLNDIQLHVQPTLSLRTAALPEVPTLPLMHIKVPVDIQATSVKRTLSLRDLYNGLIFSDFLKQAETLVPAIINGSGRIVKDHCAAHIKADGHNRPQLSFMLREDPLCYARNEETMVVAAALFHTTTANPIPLLARFIHLSGMPAEQYFMQVFTHLLELPLQLFLQFGIALDMHSQNSLLAFDLNYNPVALVYRDLGSIQVVKGVFPFNDELMHFEDMEATIMNNEDAFAELSHTLFDHLVQEFVLLADGYFHLDPDALWQQVGQLCIQIIDDCPAKPSVKMLLKHKLQAQTWAIKSLLKMRIEERTLYTQITNPMFNANI